MICFPFTSGIAEATSGCGSSISRKASWLFFCHASSSRTSATSGKRARVFCSPAFDSSYSSTSVVARMLAFRGSSEMSAVSPKEAPGKSLVIGGLSKASNTSTSPTVRKNISVPTSPCSITSEPAFTRRSCSSRLSSRKKSLPGSTTAANSDTELSFSAIAPTCAISTCCPSNV